MKRPLGPPWEAAAPWPRRWWTQSSVLPAGGGEFARQRCTPAAADAPPLALELDLADAAAPSALPLRA